MVLVVNLRGKILTKYPIGWPERAISRFFYWFSISCRQKGKLFRGHFVQYDAQIYEQIGYGTVFLTKMIM